MNFVTKQLEKKLGVDLNGDGIVGSTRGFRVAGGYNQPGSNALVNEIEKKTHIDFNHDGRIGGLPTYPPNYPPYGAPAYPYNAPPPPNFNQPANSGLVNELEKATNIDLNGDGRIGSQPNYPPPGGYYPPPYNPYGAPPPNFNQPANSGLINELEKATNIDLNRDGRIGSGQPNYPPPSGPYPSSYNPYGAPPPPPNFNQPPSSGLINELEKATNIDLNRDGRIGSGQPNYPPPGGYYPPPYNPVGVPPPNFNQPPSGSLFDELEKATNIDLNRDGRIGSGQPNYPPPGGPYPSSYNPYGAPPPPPNFNQPPSSGLINELEKATNIDLNRDGRIGSGQPNYPPPGGYYPPPYNPYGAPPPPASGLINELEKATNMDLNGDGRIGSGQPNYPRNY